MNNDDGKFELSSVRTSSGAFLNRSDDATIATIEARLARFTQLPAENGEPLHVLHYQVRLRVLFCERALALFFLGDGRAAPFLLPPLPTLLSTNKQTHTALAIHNQKAGEKYEPHYDYFHDAENVKNGGQVSVECVWVFVLRHAAWQRAEKVTGVIDQQQTTTHKQTTQPPPKKSASRRC